MDVWDSGVGVLHGVGARREAQLKRLGIRTVAELLLHYPRSYIDLSAPREIMEAPLEELCAVRAVVLRKSGEKRLHGGMKLYKVMAADDSGSMEITFFNTKFAVDSMEIDMPYIFYGRMGGDLLRREMISPLICRADAKTPFIAVYPLTAGLSGKMLAVLEAEALEHRGAMPDALTPGIRATYGLEEMSEALRMIHRPQNSGEIESAKKRLIFEELFTLTIGVGLLKSHSRGAHGIPMQPCRIDDFYAALPFTLTGAQLRAIEELTADMQSETPANRLVQGDVGSGKTMVAAAGAYFAFLSGTQSALMAPTELLARQHYDGLSLLLGKLGMQVALLTGSLTAAQKRAVREKLASGEIDLCVGTHALLSEGVEFSRLAFIITDEQHRFGVAQRAALGKKGEHAHTLVMSATPIPRTLALMIYGELDVSVLDELPPNRIPIITYKISSPKRQRAFAFIREHLDRGLAAYIVCPLVESGEEETGLVAVSDYVIELSASHFAGYTVGLLHGKMKNADKEKTMSAFRGGDIQLLISTTVVEVGVDVPRAVIMMVENAERFGLSQLHQLRGRVGRGSEQSYCILLSDSRNPDTVERLRMMCETTDGFALAEYDLKTRGPGNFLGHEQHGLPRLRIADLTTDISAVEDARTAASKLLEDDPKLNRAEHAPLKAAVERLMDNVGGAPN